MLTRETGVTEQQQLTFTDPFAGAATSSPGTVAEQPMPAMPKPTPLPAAATTEARLSGLVEQARALRERGDTGTAITRLREAMNIAPSSALIISELATTFEKMGQDQKALEQWRRIYDMGESAGIYYSAADAKLKNIEMAARVASVPKPDGSRDSTGIQPGSVLGLVNLEAVEQSDPEAQKKFTLKIPLKARPNTRIEVSDVVIQVFFYDQTQDGSIVQTNANVASHWSTLPADWSDDEIEILEVEYTQPRPDKPNETRVYYGYVTRVYYKKELQDMRAEPVALLKKYPPPLTLQTASEAPQQ